MITKVTFTILTAALYGAAAFVSAGPAVETPNHEFNFGKVAQQAELSHTFWIRSTGDDTLRVTRIVPGCGCTKMPLLDSTIAPGDSVELELHFTTKSYRGFVSKRPYFETNCGDDKNYLKIHSEIMPDPRTITPIRLNPYILDVSQFSEAPRRRARAWVVNVSDKDLNLTLVDGYGKPFDYELPEIVKAGDSAAIIVTVHEDAIETEFGHSITFDVNDEAISRFSLPVKRMYRIPKATADN